jgi:predicted negative regulator of RcsB-dependent stress response
VAIRADIGARMAARRGDLVQALDQARRALAAWDIHSDNAQSFTPEPAMRFHLARLLRAAGKTDSAATLFGSMLLPTTWLGFYTAASSLERAELLERSGDRAAARANYAAALRLWDRGDASIADLRERARAGVARLDRAR